MAQRLSNFAFVSLLLFCMVSLSLGSEVFQSFSFLKYTKSGQEPISRKNSLNLIATSYHNSYDENLSRSRVILLPYTEFIYRTKSYISGSIPEISSNVMGDYQKTIAGGSSAVFIVLPKNMDPEMHPQWREAEEYLLNNNDILIPVYFIYENEELLDIMSTIETMSGESDVPLPEKIVNSILGDNFQLTISTSETKPMKKFTGTNIQGWLAGNGDPSSPTIAIVASYDSLSASPDLSTSEKTTSSGVAMLLELSRVFNKLYSQPRTQSSYNILFALTSGGHFNYYGSKEWINSLDERVAKSLQYVLCLDSLGESSESLYLHTSRPPKDPIAKRIYDSFSDAAFSLNSNIEIMQKKVNVSNSEEPWEHQHFSKRRILASTLSSKLDPLSNLGRSHIYDLMDENTLNILKVRTQIIAEALAKFMFTTNQESLVVFEDSLAIDETTLENWMKVLQVTPRVFPYIKENFVDGLEQILQGYTTDVTKQTFTLDSKSEYVFYSETGDTKVEFSVAKPFLFDVALAFFVGSFLALLFFTKQAIQIF